MVVNYCGRQLARRLEWVAGAYHEKEGPIPHHGECLHCLQYDGMSDGRVGVRVGTWNLCNLSGKEPEVCEELGKDD